MLDMVNLETRFEKDPSIVFRKIADDFFLFPSQARSGPSLFIYTFKEVGARTWELLDGKRTAADLIEEISEEFGVGTERVRGDLSEFLGQLEQERLIHRA